MSVAQQLRRARAATTAIFFANGAALGAWAASIPALKEALRITDDTLGLALGAFAAGTMLVMFLTGTIVSKVGSQRTVLWGGLLAALCLPICAFAQGSFEFAAALFVLGATNSALDVSMNCHGSLIERDYRKPVMSSLHAAFSFGGLLGAAFVAVATKGGFGPKETLSVAAILVVITVVIGSRRTLDLRSCDEARERALLVRPNKIILAIAALIFLSFITESTMIDWSAVYLTDISRADASIAASAFGGFSLAMAIGRLFGCRSIERFGEARVLFASGAIGGLGLALSIGFPEPHFAILGFALVGIGLSNCTPILYSRASRVYSGSAELGIALAGTLGYLGFLVGPPLLGHVSHLVSLRTAFLIPLAALAIIAISALKHQQRTRAVSPSRNIV